MFDRGIFYLKHGFESDIWQSASICCYSSGSICIVPLAFTILCLNIVPYVSTLFGIVIAAFSYL